MNQIYNKKLFFQEKGVNHQYNNIILIVHLLLKVNNKINLMLLINQKIFIKNKNQKIKILIKIFKLIQIL